jgi:hypothetical protein
MADELFDLGDTVRLEHDFYSLAGVLTDPTTIKCVIRAPDTTEVTRTYAGATVSKTSTGLYYTDYAPAAPGLYRVRWVGTGTVASAEESAFTVRPTLFDTP